MADSPYAPDHGTMETHPDHRSLRKGRWSEAGRVYLVTFTTFRRQPLFRDYRIAQIACSKLVTSLPAGDGALICWVLMPDHFHAVLRLTGQTTLSRCIQRIKGRSSTACRMATQRRAPVWARAFHDHALRADEDLPTVTRYVIANPLRAGLVNNLLEYPWWNADWL